MYTESTLLLPVCGQSTRFPGTRPKWLLTHPGGNCMLREAIRGISLDGIKSIVISVNKNHITQHKVDISKILEQFADSNKDVYVCELSDTESQVDTVIQTIRRGYIDGQFYIKDCDNFFTISPTFSGDAGVAVVDLNNINMINPSNKSYVSISTNVIEIKEKNVLSNLFCCGLYYFKSPEDFIGCSGDHKYVSDILNCLISKNKIVQVQGVHGYEDWGTLQDWLSYRDRFQTIFCDIDGVLIENSGEYCGTKRGQGKPIASNIAAINGRKSAGSKIILTTSRPSSSIDETLKELNKHGIMYDYIIFDLLHGPRTIINDYATTNPYPSCMAINVERDADSLEDLL